MSSKNLSAVINTVAKTVPWDQIWTNNNNLFERIHNYWDAKIY